MSPPFFHPFFMLNDCQNKLPFETPFAFFSSTSFPFRIFPPFGLMETYIDLSNPPSENGNRAAVLFEWHIAE